MVRSWEMITSWRIQEDICRWEGALEAIVRYEGAVVPDLDRVRRGRRAVRKFIPHADCAQSVRVKEEKWASYAQYSSVPLP
eukprot:5264632-Prymnesium_polylepis.1